MRILRNPEPLSGAGGAHPAADNPPTPTPAPPSDPSPPEPTPPAAPPAAAAVLSSDVQEGDAAEIVRLRRDLETERKGRKGIETRVSELEDENRRLKTPPPPPPPKAKKSWLDGATFFE